MLQQLRVAAVESPTVTQDEYAVFISFRFGEALNEARALKAALEARGIKSFVSDVGAGGNVQTEIGTAIGQSKVQVLQDL